VIPVNPNTASNILWKHSPLDGINHSAVRSRGVQNSRPHDFGTIWTINAESEHAMLGADVNTILSNVQGLSDFPK
jgi:hypothetical protein